ncbi:uncharacterized protein [Eurosta solidaginis]|uniref:uncharacterized protein n=1 Tax=Eurosta solidaginis TaxID=178769 RepID=UPI0035307CB5
MYKLPTNAKRNKRNNKSNKKTDKQYVQRQQLSAIRAMGNNTSRRRARASVNNSNAAAVAGASSTSLPHAPPESMYDALRVHRRGMLETCKSIPAPSKLRLKAASEVTSEMCGNALEQSILDSNTMQSSESTVGPTRPDQHARCSAKRSSSLHATKKTTDASKTTYIECDTKIATTKTHTKPLTDARTHKIVLETHAALATASQLTKENTNAIKYATKTTVNTANERMTKAVGETETAEVCSVELRRAQSADRLTSQSTTMPISADAQVDMKSKFSENKCPLAVLTNVSNQRKLEANSTISASAQQPHSNNNQLLSNRWSLVHDINRAEYESTSTKQSNSENSTEDIERSLNLAARKAKLKSEFFRDFALHEVSNKRLTKSTTVIDVCGKDSTEPFLEKNQKSLLNLRIGVSGTTTFPPLPATVLPTIAVHESETPATTSIVAKRKLDLKRKFEQQTAPKTLPTSEQYLPASNVFPRVEKLVQKFDTKSTSPVRKMIVNPNKTNQAADSNMLTLKPDVLEQRNSPVSDEGCNLGQSPYSSDNEDNDTTNMGKSKRKEKVARSASSDSALGLEVDESMDTTPAQQPTGTQQRRMTLTVTDLPLRPALLPLAEPTALPDSPPIDLPQQISNILPAPATIPSKVLLEERFVELPDDPRSLAPSQPCSRRESAQSCISDFTATECPGGRRFVRTPSVVVSDYSDEVMCGITLEEIEYFRAQRMRRRHSSLDTANEGEGESDVSESSSCSNLYYCGSTISALDGNECYINGIPTPLDRKTSACSTCSASADEESFTIPEDRQPPNKDLADLLAAQHLSTKQTTTKKVGLVVPMNENSSEKAPY